MSDYTVIERNGWSYVAREDGTLPDHSGPWRYRWEAQEYADELNGRSNLPKSTSSQDENA